MNVYLGMPVLYRLRPGQVRAGQNELAALVTRVNARKTRKEADGSETVVVEETVDLVAFVPDSEPLRQHRVMALSEKVTGHCWLPTDAPLGAPGIPDGRIVAELADAHAKIKTLSDQIVELAGIVTAPSAEAAAPAPAKPPAAAPKQ